MNEWHGAEKVADCRSRAAIPHRTEGEGVLVDELALLFGVRPR